MRDVAVTPPYIKTEDAGYKPVVSRSKGMAKEILFFSGHFSPLPPSNIRREDEFWREDGWGGTPTTFLSKKYFFLFFCVFGRKPGLRRYKSIRRGRKFFCDIFIFQRNSSSLAESKTPFLIERGFSWNNNAMSGN